MYQKCIQRELALVLLEYTDHCTNLHSVLKVK